MALMGSITNLIARTAPGLVPVVGMGATQILYTDRNPYTVVEVLGPKKLVLQADTYRRTDKNGMCDSGQAYLYASDPNGKKVTVSLRKDGKWRKVGEDRTNGFVIGWREKYHDFSF